MTSYFCRGTSIVCAAMSPDPRVSVRYRLSGSLPFLNLPSQNRSEVRIARPEIEGIEASRVSIMPQGLDAQVSRQELSDLLAFLQSLR